MDKPYMFPQDFNMYESDSNGIHVNLSEINKMIEYGVITVDREKLKEYKFDTTVNSDYSHGQARGVLTTKFSL